MNRKQKKTLIRIIAASVLAGAALLLQHRSSAVSVFLLAAAYITVGYDVLAEAFHGIVSLQPFDENFLMCVATVGAIALGVPVKGQVSFFARRGELDARKVAVQRPGGAIAEGEELFVDCHVPAIQGAKQFSLCPSCASLEEYWRTTVRNTEEAIHPKRWLMSVDEWRVANRCAKCRARKVSPGRLMGESVAPISPESVLSVRSIFLKESFTFRPER